MRRIISISVLFLILSLSIMSVYAINQDELNQAKTLIDSNISCNKLTNDQLEIIGEATVHLEHDFRASMPEISWREISDFRNVLAHEYWNIDLEIVWKAATIEIQELKRAILPIV